MSMSQANASLLIDVAAETSRLGVTLTQAEQIVTQSANRMGKQVDNGLGGALDKIGRRIQGALVMGVAVQGIDRSIRSAIDSIKAGGTFTEAGVAFGEGIADGLRSVPIAGSVGGALADSALYGLMQVKDQIPDIFKDVATTISGPGLFSQFFDGLDAMEMEAKQVQSRIEAQANFVALERQRQIRIGSELSKLQAEQHKYTADPVRSMMSTMANAGIQTADTALGSFRFGLGGAGDVSRNIYSAAQEQVKLLDRIRELQSELNDSLKATN